MTRDVVNHAQAVGRLRADRPSRPATCASERQEVGKPNPPCTVCRFPGAPDKYKKTYEKECASGTNGSEHSVKLDLYFGDMPIWGHCRQRAPLSCAKQQAASSNRLERPVFTGFSQERSFPRWCRNAKPVAVTRLPTVGFTRAQFCPWYGMWSSPT